MRKFKFINILLLLSSLAVAGLAHAAGKDVSFHESHVQKREATSSTTKVDINSADVVSLTSLKGIGKKRAEAIIAYRNEHGRFNSIDELTKVKGISKSIIDKNREHITLS